MNKNVEAVTEFVSSNHAALAEFARESFRMHGRGVVRVELPKKGTVGALIYHDLDEMRRLTARLSPESEGDVVIRMIETYDPERQGVVMVEIQGEKAVSMKMNLNPPTLVAEPGGVH
jgi:hypothetical protein